MPVLDPRLANVKIVFDELKRLAAELRRDGIEVKLKTHGGFGPDLKIDDSISIIASVEP